MALSRRAANRFQASIWPGFVDAMTGLLLVLMFVLTIFAIVQFVLTETITGQDAEISEISEEMSQLADALGLERAQNRRLSDRVGELVVTLGRSRDDLAAQSALVEALRIKTAEQEESLRGAVSRIADFEARVAVLLAQRSEGRARIAGLEAERDELASERERMEAALAALRGEADAQAEAARLAAARREAFEALIADLRRRASEQRDAEATLNVRIGELEAKLSEQERLRLSDAAAAEALRRRLEESGAELAAMTLMLEEQRREAEETLTLLAAADAAKERLGEELEAAIAAQRAAESGTDRKLSEAERNAILLGEAHRLLADVAEESVAALRQRALLNRQIAALRGQLEGLQALLDEAREKEAASRVQIDSLGRNLNVALARAAAEERRRRMLEEAERLRLEDEKRDLEKYRSEFFGRLRDVLGNREGVRIVGDRFVFPSEVLFALGEADLSAEGRREIARAARILVDAITEIPDGVDWVLQVDGHTDSVPLSGSGRFRDNWELSQARALSVVRYLIDDVGLPADRLSANGFGEFQPVAAGTDPAALAQNRRIELKLTGK